ncbi:CapA family protein [Brevibacillus fluminis]|uniref:CapA family protein n=1 Tax=Brevibacillus fluminis TaxID=511487 RepID=UPI003F8C360C
MKKRSMVSSVIACLAVLLTVGCTIPQQSATPNVQTDESKTENQAGTVLASPPVPGNAAPAPVQPSEPVAPVEHELTLMAVGDIMVHDQQLEAAWDPKAKTYRFDPFFAKIEPTLKQADLLLGNLETTMSGSDQRFTGYPMFNSPESLATTLKNVGFSAVTTANNHSLDRHELGVLRTIDNLDKVKLPHTGTFRTAEARNEPLILEKNGIKLGVLAYTYGTNGIKIPAGKPYLVNLIDPQLIRKDVARARELGADVVAVALHFGVEYQRQPNDAQRKAADLCFAAGADLILGSHPHVVQPYEWREIHNPDGSTRRGLVMYSLGNFISAQRWDYKDVGAILKVVLKKTDPGSTVLAQAEVIPTYVVYQKVAGKRSYTIYPLQETVLAYKAKKEKGLPKETYQTMEKLLQEMTIHVSSMSSPKKAM